MTNCNRARKRSSPAFRCAPMRLVLRRIGVQQREPPTTRLHNPTWRVPYRGDVEMIRLDSPSAEERGMQQSCL